MWIFFSSLFTYSSAPICVSAMPAECGCNGMRCVPEHLSLRSLVRNEAGVTPVTFAIQIGLGLARHAKLHHNHAELTLEITSERFRDQKLASLHDSGSAS